MTFSGLTSPRDHQLLFEGQPVNQSVHGSDFWQTNFDVATQSWSLTLSNRQFFVSKAQPE